MEGLRFVVHFFPEWNDIHFLSAAFWLRTIQWIFILIFKGVPFSFGFHTAFGIHWKILAVAYTAILYFILLLSLPEILKNPDLKLKMIPLWIYLGLLILTLAVGIGQSKFGKGLLMVLCLFGLVGLQPLVFAEPFGKIFQYQGYCYSQLGRNWAARPEFLKRFLNQLPLDPSVSENHARLFYGKMPFAIVNMLDELNESRNMNFSLKTFPFERYPVFYESIMNDIPTGLAGMHWFYFGLGNLYESPQALQTASYLDQITGENSKWFYRGIGLAKTHAWLETGYFTGEAFRKNLPPISAENLPNFYWGAGWAAADIFPTDDI